MPALCMRLLGDFHFVYDGTLVTTVDQTRLQALLAYLLFHRVYSQSRKYLAILFWLDCGNVITWRGT